MKAWLLSVTSVVLLTVIAELVICDGKMKKYIRGIVRLVLVITLFMPVLKAIKNDVKLDFEIPTASESIIDDSYLERVHAARYALAEKEIEKNFQKQGIENVHVNISIYYGAEVEIDYVYVDLTDAVITGNTENILTIERVKRIVSERLNIAEERIVIYGIA